MELSASVASPSERDSRYCEASTNTDSSFFTLEDEIMMLRRQNQALKQRVLELEEEMTEVRWGMKEIAGSNHKVKFYTGLTNY